jgi:hypothetical protein
MEYAEWHALGVKLYGPNMQDWKFKCVRCGHIQTGHDMARVAEDWKTEVFFSCIGRWTRDVGCNWTLGGLFTVHKREVISEGGKVPVFLFADEPVLQEATQ